ncbi:uncharacterized protein LOC131319619 [Rhododendron vialii]|uniref:uncharacterized protein LOC131319619 n=1 Tax=Rhododendron vialii TaxID=182163 RepID=UPI00265FCB99|nr:uncharacterized protein LOC131319619 [Rhododendron vialii]
MTGVVGRGSRTSDPKEKQHEQDLQTPSSNKHRSPLPGGRPFTFRQLTAAATAALLAAAGMVGVEDFAFVVFSLIYMYFLSRVAFPRLSPSMESPVFGRNNKVLSNYILIAALIGLVLPIAYIIEGIFDNDKEGIKAAAPHVFLLSSQVFMEGVSASDKFSLPIRVFVPVFYNSRRIFTIVDWMRAEISKADELQSQSGSRRLYVGRWLAVANMALWCFNLFGFLVPVYLPKAFKTYYSGYKVNDKI